MNDIKLLEIAFFTIIGIIIIFFTWLILSEMIKTRRENKEQLSRNIPDVYEIHLIECAIDKEIHRLNIMASCEGNPKKYSDIVEYMKNHQRALGKIESLFWILR